MDSRTQVAVKYYQRLGSRLGYKFIQKKRQHLGFFPNGENENLSLSDSLILMERLVAEKLQFKAGDRVLDAGSGPGLVSVFLATQYKVKVLGITVVPHEMEHGRKMASELNLSDSIDFQIMDYTSTGLPDKSFDCIFTLETLTHAYDLEATIKEFFRLLKPGGKIALFEYTMVRGDQLTNYERKIFEYIISESLSGLKFLRQDEFSKFLTQAGFINVEEKDITTNVLPYWRRRFYNLAIYFYWLVKFFRLQKFFINITGAVEGYIFAKKGLLRYSIFTGQK